jgi:NAD-dependent dihydropyrimidine dehydrogenase PreA subunit
MELASIAEPDCKFAPGFMIPVIDPMRCEAKGPCVPICPYDVLAIRVVPGEEKAKLPFFGRVRLFVHGGKQPLPSILMLAMAAAYACRPARKRRSSCSAHVQQRFPESAPRPRSLTPPRIATTRSPNPGPHALGICTR